MPKLLNKIIVSLMLFIFIFSLALSSFVPVVKAQQVGPWYSQSFPQYYTKVFEQGNETEVFGERYTAAQTQWVFYAIPAQIISSIISPEFAICAMSLDMGQCISGAYNGLRDKFTELEEYFNINLGYAGEESGLAYSESNSNFSTYDFFYNNPTSGVGYFLRKANNLNLVPEAKAQGFGYGAATAIQDLWKVMRNISYALLIFAVIIIAFMIMFRVKLSPQTVVSIQSSLPKIIITLLLITFSYAIAGFLIDLMYLVIGLLSALLVSAKISNADAVAIFNDLTTNKNAFILTIQFVIVWFVAALMTTLSMSFFGGLFALIWTVVVIILAIIGIFRISFLLIKTYVSIILLIVFGPIQILLGVVVPGQGIGPWMKSLASQLAVFPVVGGMFVLAFYFLAAASVIIDDAGVAITQGWMIPFGLQGGQLATQGSWDPPLTWGTNGSRFLYMMVAYVIFLMIPRTADILKSAMQGKEFGYGTAIGEAHGPVRTGVGPVGAGAVGFVGEGLTTPRVPGDRRWRGRLAAEDWKTDATKQIVQSIQRKISG